MKAYTWFVYKGASFNLWNPDTGKYYASVDSNEIIKELQRKRVESTKSFTDFDDSVKNDITTLSCYRARIAFRDVTRSTDSRTIIAALLPPEVVAVDSAPVILWPDGTYPVEKHEAYLLGFLSSMILDWFARRLVTLHLTFNIFNNLPIPRIGFEPKCTDPTALRVIEISGRLAAVDSRFKDWAQAVGVPVGSANDCEVKKELIYELDACVAHLYELDEDDLACLYQTFHYKPDHHADRYKAMLKYFREQPWLK